MSLSGIYAAAVEPTANTLSTPSSSSLHTTLSDVPDLPDGRWRFLATYRRDPPVYNLRIVSVCAKAMQELAKMDPNRLLTTSRTWNGPETSGSVTVEGGALTTVRWAMWLIASAVRDMMTRDRFETALFYGFWQDVQVASVRFDPPSELAKGAEDNEPKQPDSKVVYTHTTVPDSGRPLAFDLSSGTVGAFANDDNLRAEIEYLSTAVDEKDILMAIIWLILSLTPNYRKPLKIFRCNVFGIYHAMLTIWNRAHTVGPEQHVLVGGDLINMLAKLPETMERDDKYCEMIIKIKERGTLVGHGVIRKGPPKPGYLSANVSVYDER
ncbi:MAG: hypothetical protein Q9207_002992 [Kuettlingeria erythrocarpa]